LFPLCQVCLLQSLQSLFTIHIGKLNSRTVAQYAEILLPYFLDPENLFVISRFIFTNDLPPHHASCSDFCHWGQRFRYTPYDESKVLCSILLFSNLLREVLIATSIGWIMKPSNLSNHWSTLTASSPLTTINSTSLLQDHEGFRKYIKETKNTICGQDPIKVLLELIRLSDKAYHSRFSSVLTQINYLPLTSHFCE
jgi:MEMO1 family protein